MASSIFQASNLIVSNGVGDLLPAANGTQALGNSSNAWSSLDVYNVTTYGNTTLNNISTFKGVATEGWGVPAVYKIGNTVAATNTGTASIAAYTVGAADGTFEVSGNFLITTSTTHSFSLDCVYTDESNSARTMILPMESLLSGNLLSGGLMTAAVGVGPYSSPVMTIRCKAATSITLRTSAGGTFTTVVYNARAIIKQVA